MIGTKLHELAEFVTDPLVDEMMAAPKFVMSQEVCDLMARQDVAKSVCSMIDAGIMRLPYNPVLIEFQPVATLRWFVLMSEGEGRFVCRVAAYLPASGEATTYEGAIDVKFQPAAGERKAHMRVEANRDTIPHAYACGYAAAFSLLMLNTKGIEKQVIVSNKINKARAKHHDGRLPIPTYTVIRIGTIYDRSGRGHDASGPTGRHMPVHLRIGYARRQHFGPGNEDEKIVYIPPCLVNYREGDDARPRLPQKEVRI